MHEGKRPGGLTALAVLNFVFAGFDALNFVGCAIWLVTGQLPGDPAEARHTAASAEEEPAADREEATASPQDAAAEAEEEPDEHEMTQRALRLGLLNGLLAALLITSGVGYLQQKRFLGRYVGNTYAVCSIGLTVLSLAIIPKGIPGTGFTPLSMLALIYPLVTLVLLNTTFKTDFTE